MYVYRVDPGGCGTRAAKVLSERERKLKKKGRPLKKPVSCFAGYNLFSDISGKQFSLKKNAALAFLHWDDG